MMLAKLINRIRFPKFHLKLNVIIFALLYSVVTLLLFNNHLFNFSLSHLDIKTYNGVYIYASLIVLQLIIVFLLVLTFALVHKSIKVLCILLLIGNSIAHYFLSNYNVMLDFTMMGNVFNTNLSESVELFNLNTLYYLILFGVIPSYIISQIEIIKVAFFKRCIAVFISLSIILCTAFGNTRIWLWYDMNSKYIGGLSLPMSYIANSARYLSAISFKDKKVINLAAPNFINANKTTVVMILGESARAKSFSMYGYHRNTNPYLSKDGVVALSNVTSCATYTTSSVKCILSHLGSSTPWHTSYEVLPSYLQRNGINVIWRSNNTGDPAMSVNTYEKAQTIRSRCKGGDCNALFSDGILMHGLKNVLENNIEGNNFIVLHQTGSHGPLYYSKYPSEFERFKPACKSVEPQKCSHHELVNAYDNTIIYADYLAHQVVSLLSSFKDRSMIMIYISDHGESLGEHNFFLHGAPMSIAPAEQKEIPFLVWMSKKFKQEHKVSSSQLLTRKKSSQDNIFHSIMGAFNMRSQFYKKELDIFRN